MADAIWISAGAWALAGFLGGVHCLGMCGGLVAALGMQAGPNRWRMLLLANAGRLLAYTSLGLLLGGVSGMLGYLPFAALVQTILYLFSLLLILVLGLYLAGWSKLLNKIERLGLPLWRQLQPRFARLLPLRSGRAALLAGALWGFLPCGMVYSAALAAMSSGGAISGGVLMLAFGLGTLPNLLLMGAAAAQLNQLRQHYLIRLVAATLLIGWAMFGFVRWCVFTLSA